MPTKKKVTKETVDSTKKVTVNKSKKKVTEESGNSKKQNSLKELNILGIKCQVNDFGKNSEINFSQIGDEICINATLASVIYCNKSEVEKSGYKLVAGSNILINYE